VFFCWFVATGKEDDVDDPSSVVGGGVLQDGLLSVVVDTGAVATNADERAALAASDGEQSPPADTEFSIWDEVDVLVLIVAVVSFFSF